MKIETVILASNDNPDYLEFWPIVEKAWKLMGVEPVLIYTGKSQQKLTGNVVYFDSKNLNSAFVAQNIRILYPSLLQDSNCIVSDIDSLPLSRNYFFNSVESCTSDSFIIYRPDAGVPKNMISMMWNAANSSTWKEIFNIESEEEIHKMLNKWYTSKYSIRGKAWYTDQIKLRKYVDKFEKKYPGRVIALDDETLGFNRLNRTKLDFHLDLMRKNKTIFTDFHMPRPFSNYKEIIYEVFENYQCYLRE